MGLACPFLQPRVSRGLVGEVDGGTGNSERRRSSTGSRDSPPRAKPTMVVGLAMLAGSDAPPSNWFSNNRWWN